MISPTFGFFSSDIFDVRLYLDIDGVSFDSDYQITPGKKQLILRNMGRDVSGKKIVYVSANKVQDSDSTRSSGTGGLK